jgi:hypothetical protein
VGLYTLLKNLGCPRIATLKPADLNHVADTGSVKLDALLKWLTSTPGPITSSNVVGTKFTPDQLAAYARLEGTGAALSRVQIAHRRQEDERKAAPAREEASLLQQQIDDLAHQQQLLLAQRQALTAVLAQRAAAVQDARQRVQAAQGDASLPPVTELDEALSQLSAASSRFTALATHRDSDAGDGGGDSRPGAAVLWPSQCDLTAYLAANSRYLLALKQVRPVPAFGSV